MSAAARPSWRSATVVENREVASGIRRITLERPGTLRAEPGAHVDVRVPVGERTELRSYSVVESHEDPSRFSISVLLTPRTRGGAAAMHALAVGTAIECTQPLQNFPLRIGASRYVLVAGGVGITALIAGARLLTRLGADVRLVYVGRSRARMAYLDELAEELGERLEVHIDDEGTPLLVDDLVADAARSVDGHAFGGEFYVCGPLRLMDAIRRAWDAAELPAYALRFETFGNSGWHDPQDFVATIPERGITTVVSAQDTLLRALQRAGADLLYDCLKGECGLCRMPVDAVSGAIDHRDVFLSRRQAEAGTSMCVCVSRVVPSPGASEPAVLTLRMP